MSHSDQLNDQRVLSLDDQDSAYEIISSDEVDRVVEVLEDLMNRVKSENIRSILDEAADEIYSLVYSEEHADADAA